MLEDGVGVLVMTRYCSVQSLSSKRPLSLQLPIVSAKYSFPGICILAHSSIEITKDYHLVVCRGAFATAAELWVETVFYCRFSLKSWGVHTEKCGILLFFRGRCMDIMWSEWQVGRFSSLEQMEVLTMKPMPERCSSVVGFPNQKRVYPVPCSWRLPSPGKRTLLRTAMLTLNLDSSCVIRAERHSGQLLWAASSMVPTFQHATFSIFALLEVGSYLPYFNVLGLLEKIPVDRG